MSPETAPILSYTRTSEIPIWLAKLSDHQLSDLVEKRLQGFPAGLPLPGRDEEPKDILEYAFRKADRDLRARFRQALRGVVDRLAAEVLSRGTALLDDRYDFLEGACSLVAYTNCGEAWDTLSLLYNRLANGNAKAVRSAILRCLSGLVRPPESQTLDVFGPMVEKFESLLADYDLCGLAFQALFRYDTRRAGRAVPRLARTLLSQRPKDATHPLARILSPVVGLLSEGEQKAFIADAWDATLRAAVKGSTELVDCVLQGLREMWGVTRGARFHIEFLSELRLLTELSVEAGRHIKFADETAGLKHTSFGSGMIADYLSCMQPGVADMLNPTAGPVRKYESPGLETDDDWVVLVRDTPIGYEDTLDQILKSEVQVRVYQPPKSGWTIYVGEPCRKRKTGESSAFIRIAPEQDYYPMYPNSKACGQNMASRKAE
jgi:hypothetical protein